MADINKEASWVTARLLEVGNATNDGANVLITDANIQYYNAGGLANTLPIIKGGTNATTAADARTNLGVPSTGDVTSAINTAVAPKADKVTGATSGNFAGLDANGDLTDSGSKASDFIPALASGVTPGDIAIIGSNQNISDSGVSKDNLILAPQLASNNFKTDAVPYIYRQTGGGIGVGNREYDSIVGGSVVWNQLFNSISKATNDGITTEYDSTNHVIKITNNSRTSNYGSGSTRGTLVDASSMVSTHKYLTCFTPSVTGVILYINGLMNYKNVHQGSASISLRINYAYDFVTDHPVGDVTTVSFICIDLTALFGSTIADHIYNLEQATTGAGLAYFRKMFPEAYYPYTAQPSLESVSGLQSHKTVGFNLFDKSNYQYLNAYINGTLHGDGVLTANSAHTTLWVRCLPNTEYTISRLRTSSNERFYVAWASETPALNTVTVHDIIAASNSGTVGTTMSLHITTGASAQYLVVWAWWTTSVIEEAKDTLCIHVTGDGTKDGVYESYEEHTYPLDDSLTLRGVAVIDDNNNIKFDGDTYAPDGTVTRRYGIVDLGTLDWTYASAASDTRFYTTSIACNAPTSTAVTVKAVCALYTTMPYNQVNGQTSHDMVMGAVKSGNKVYFVIKNLSYTSAAAFKTAMSGVYLIYELATPTTETAEPYESLQICDPLGTEEYVTTGIVPVGHVTQYPEDAVKKLDGLPSDFSTLIAPTEVAYKATQNYTVGSYLIVNNQLYRVTSAIASGGTISVGTNVVATTIMAELLALT